MKELSREQMKKVMGGDPPLNACQTACGYSAGDAWQCTNNSQTYPYYCTAPGTLPPVYYTEGFACGLLAHCGGDA